MKLRKLNEQAVHSIKIADYFDMSIDYLLDRIKIKKDKRWNLMICYKCLVKLNT